MAKDNLDHLAFDFLQEQVFAGHSLAWPVLGYESTVGSLQRDRMGEYMQRRYAPNNMWLVVAGNVDVPAVITVAERCCGAWKTVEDASRRTPPPVHKGVGKLVVDRFRQQIVALTFPSVSARDPRAETVAAAVQILGGDNSRFFWNIVQKGIAPRAGAHHLDYTDSGVFILYGSCEPERADALLEAMRNEASRICSEPVLEREVERVKNRRRTSLAMDAETPYCRLTQLMDDMECYGRPRTVEETLAEVETVTAKSVHEYLQAFPIDREGYLISVGPRDLPEAG